MAASSRGPRRMESLNDVQVDGRVEVLEVADHIARAAGHRRSAGKSSLATEHRGRTFARKVRIETLPCLGPTGSLLCGCSLRRPSRRLSLFTCRRRGRTGPRNPRWRQDRAGGLDAGRSCRRPVQDHRQVRAAARRQVTRAVGHRCHRPAMSTRRSIRVTPGGQAWPSRCWPTSAWSSSTGERRRSSTSCPTLTWRCEHSPRAGQPKVTQ